MSAATSKRTRPQVSSGVEGGPHLAGAFLDAREIDELRAKLIGLVQAPATKIAQLATAPAAKLARVFGAYAAKEAA